MNCTQLEAEWADRLADRSAPFLQDDEGWSPAARAHLAECAVCRRTVAADQALEPAIRAWRTLPEPTIDRDRLLTALEQARVLPMPHPMATPQPVRRPIAKAPVWAVALALGLIVAVGLFTPVPTPNTVVQTPPPGVTTVKQVVASAAPVSDAMAGLWREMQAGSVQAAQSTVASLEQLPTIPRVELVTLPATREPSSGEPLAGGPIDDDPPVDAELAVEAPRPAWLGWGTPISREVRSAFRFLESALPSEPTRS
jgi:hypothetical protein